MWSGFRANVRPPVFTAGSLQYPWSLKIRPTKVSSMPNETNDKWQQAGWATYAAIMLFGGGLVAIVNGIWALRYNDRQADLVLAEKNLDLWGAVALIGGILLLTAGIGVFHGKSWARWTGIALSVGAIVWSVGWAEIQPTQSLIGALIFASVVYALATNPVTVTTTE
jgi:hypothetical protein